MQEPLVRFCFDQSLKGTGIFPLQSGPHVSLKLEGGNLAEGLSFWSSPALQKTVFDVV